MKKFSGKGVYGAVAVGKISVFERQGIKVKRVSIENADAEIERLENAKETATLQLGEIYEKALKEVGEANAQIFEIHMMMVEDEDYNDAIYEMIRSQNVNAEYAVATTGKNFAEPFAVTNARIFSLSSDTVSLGARSSAQIITFSSDTALLL